MVWYHGVAVFIVKQPPLLTTQCFNITSALCLVSLAHFHPHSVPEAVATDDRDKMKDLSGCEHCWEHLE